MVWDMNSYPDPSPMYDHLLDEPQAVPQARQAQEGDVGLRSLQ
jgi:hypothetical protein